MQGQRAKFVLCGGPSPLCTNRVRPSALARASRHAVVFTVAALRSRREVLNPASYANSSVSRQALQAVARARLPRHRLTIRRPRRMILAIGQSHVAERIRPASRLTFGLAPADGNRQDDSHRVPTRTATTASTRAKPRFTRCWPARLCVPVIRQYVASSPRHRWAAAQQTSAEYVLGGDVVALGFGGGEHPCSGG